MTTQPDVTSRGEAAPRVLGDAPAAAAATAQPGRAAPPTVPAGADAAAVYRYETELRRLRAELERQDEAMRQLTARLRQAEREAATASGAVVEAVGAELAGWQARALAAEGELAAVRATKVYRVASPFMAAYRVRRRLPELARKLATRLS